MAESIVKLRVDATGATSALKGVQNQTNKLQQSFGGLKTAIAGVGFTVLAQKTIAQATTFQSLELRMKVLTSEFGEFSAVQELVTKAQDKFNLSIIEATRGLTDIFARLRPLGISLNEIETVFFGFNSIAISAGLNATEASAAFTQLAQALGSGRLQGDEFRTIAEQVPQLLKAISDETGIGTGRLKEFASKGLLKADIIIRALAGSANELSDQLEDIIDDSVEQKFKDFSNAVLDLQIALADKVFPIILKVTEATTKLVEGFARFVDSELGQVTAIFIGFGLAIKGVTVIIPILSAQIVALKTNFAVLSLGAKIFTGQFVATNTTLAATTVAFANATAAANAFKLALAKTGVGLLVVGLGFLVAEILKANNAQKEFNQLLETGSAEIQREEIEQLETSVKNLNEQLAKRNKILDFLLTTTGLDVFTKDTADFKEEISKVTKNLNKLKDALPDAEQRDLGRFFDTQLKNINKSNEALKKNNKIEKELTEKGKIQAEFKAEIERLEERKNKLLIENNGEMSKENATKFANLRLALDENKQLKLANLLTKEKNKNLQDQEQLFLNIGKSVEDGIVSNLADAVEGTKTLAQAAVSVLNDLKRSLIEVAIQRSIAGLGERFGGFLGDVFKNLGKRANGGPVSAGGAFVVGEKGPEILTMGSSRGFITPNNQLGGSTTNIVNVSVDASGSSVQGSQAEGQALGQLIAAVVQTTIVQEQRAGGLLNR